MKNRPEVTLSVALSLDGFMDDSSPRRREFSDAMDWAEIDRLRAESDAILVGANTVRKDNPKLSIKSEELRLKRSEGGKSAEPDKVTLTRSGELDSGSKFFTHGTSRKFVFCPAADMRRLQANFGPNVLVETLAEQHDWLQPLLATLSNRGIKKLLVEGGAQMHRIFLETKLFDTLRVAWAACTLGEEGSAPFPILNFAPGSTPAGLRLINSERVGSMFVAWYGPQ